MCSTTRFHQEAVKTFLHLASFERQDHKLHGTDALNAEIQYIKNATIDKLTADDFGSILKWSFLMAATDVEAMRAKHREWEQAQDGALMTLDLKPAPIDPKRKRAAKNIATPKSKAAKASLEAMAMFCGK